MFPSSIAIGGGNSIAVSSSQLQGWTVDPQTGSISLTSKLTPVITGELLPNPSRGLVYQVTVEPCASGHCTDVGTSSIKDGQVGLLMPFFPLGSPQENPERIALDSSGHYLYAILAEFDIGHFLGIAQVTPNGNLATAISENTQICSGNDIAATSSGTNDYVYITCSGGGIELYVVDNTSGAVVSSTSFATEGSAEGMVVDPAGQYLLVADTSVNTVDVFKIDPSTGHLGNAFTQTLAGTQPNVLTFDSSGHFLYVANGGCIPQPPAATCPNQGPNGLQAFSWSNGKLVMIASYPTDHNPVSLAVWKP
ncbi:MAG: beta-propeller fold lactonase family protein [Acidobacteria bacterium]|nr:beta-propeller fold lactonase family protein [Acidobacteriota bacterium]